jgi:hypothetical protein
MERGCILPISRASSVHHEAATQLTFSNYLFVVLSFVVLHREQQAIGHFVRARLVEIARHRRARVTVVAVAVDSMAALPLSLLLAALALLLAYSWSSWSIDARIDSPSPLFVRCPSRSLVRRSPLPSSPLPPLDHTHTLNYLARALQYEQKPRVFRANALEAYGWTAFDRWSPDAFVSAAAVGHGPAQLLVKRSHNATFRFANLRTERPFVRTEQRAHRAEERDSDGVQWPQLPLFVQPFTTHNLSTRAFFEQIQSHTAHPDGEYLYFADGVGVLGPTLSQSIMPAEPLCPHADIDRCDMSLWIGRPGVSAYAHYDSSHNMYVQIKGRKKFVLAPPAAARCGLGLFPSLHPFYRQVQRDLMDESVDDGSVMVPTRSKIGSAASACCTLDLLEVVLEPGDLLYIPPLWFHRVTSLPSSPPSPSFSVSSWWAGRAFETTAKVLQQPLPFETHWTRHQMLFAARLYLRMLYAALETHLRAVDPSSTPPPDVGPFLAAELLVTRFYPLFNEHPPIDGRWCADMRRNVTTQPRASAAARALADCSHIEARDLRAMLPASVAVPAHASSAALLAALRSHFAKYVDRQVSLYRSVDAEMARLHVQNVAEEIAWFALDGRVEHLYPYLACCVVEQP